MGGRTMQARMRNRTRRAARGFSLLELLLVIGIIAFLMSAITVIYLRQIHYAKIQGAQALIKRLTLALNRYESELRELPPDTGMWNEKNAEAETTIDPVTRKKTVLSDPGALWRYLGQELDVRRPGDNLVIRKFGPIEKFSPTELKAYEDSTYGPSYIVIDPWSKPIGYIGSPRRKIHNRDGVDLFSAGPDGKTASSDGMDNGRNQEDNKAYDGQDNDGDGDIDNATELGEAVYDGALTQFKKDKKEKEVLDDINNWDPQ